MAGALNRRSRGGVSEDNGDTPSKASSRGGTDDGGGATIASGTHWETPEVLAAMGDEDFGRAVDRSAASHRKIFKNQEKNWALVRLRVNLQPARAAGDLVKQGAAGLFRQDAKQVVNLNFACNEGEFLRNAKHGEPVTSVVFKRFGQPKKAADKKDAGAKQQVTQHVLPAVKNVPKYTAYQYSANGNAKLDEDQPKRRLLYADGEGEMRAASDDEVSTSEDTEDEAVLEAARKTGSPFKTGGKGSSQDPSTQKMTYSMRAAEARRRREDAVAFAAAGTEWAPANDYLLFALTSSLGETARAIESISAVLGIKAMTLRARLLLLNETGDGGGSGGGNAGGATRHSDGMDHDGAAAHTKKETTDSPKQSVLNTNKNILSLAAVYAQAKTAVANGVTAHAEWRELAMTAAESVRRNRLERAGLLISVDLTGDDEHVGAGVGGSNDSSNNSSKRNTRGVNDDFADMLRVVPKADPEDDDGEGDLDGGDDAVPPGASPGAGPCNLGNPGAPGNARGGNNSKNENNSVAAVNAAERQRLNVWNLTAWRFLVLSGDIHGLDRGTDALRAHGRTGNDSQHEFHFHDQTVDVAVDSFRTLFCKRCHTYDCPLHETHHKQQRVVKVDLDAGSFPHKLVDKTNDDDDDDDGCVLLPEPCSNGCWVSASKTHAAAAVLHWNPLEFRLEGTTRFLRNTDGNREGETGVRTPFTDYSQRVNGGVRWSVFEESFYQKLRVVYDQETDTGATPCAIARALCGPSCASVCTRLRFDIASEAFACASKRKAKGGGDDDSDDEYSDPRARGRWGGKRKASSSRRKKTNATIKRRMQNNTNAEAVAMQYLPCECCAPGEDGKARIGRFTKSRLPVSPKLVTVRTDYSDCLSIRRPIHAQQGLTLSFYNSKPGGGCDVKGGCSCVRDGNFCEIWCGCSGRCGNDFTGCNCKTACNSRACPCVAANRECDPDLCKRCAYTCEVATHARRDGWPWKELCMPVPPPPPPPTEPTRVKLRPTEMCDNMKLTLHRRKHVQMGLSGVAGWGAFLRDGASKNEMIGEYTGEIIGQEEADRRGKVYDVNYQLSFLFNLNDKFVLDGHALGNKLKFINHSETPNCVPKVLMCRGEHRIGMFALRDVAPGEELFFDYRYEKEKAPEWVDFDFDKQGGERRVSEGCT